MEADSYSEEDGKGFGRPVQKRRISIVARVILYVLAGLILLGDLGCIGGVVYDSILLNDNSNFEVSFWTVPGLVLLMMLISGIVLCISTARLRKSTVLAWTIVNWACFWSSLLLTAIVASSNLFLVTLIFIGISTILQIIACFVYTFTCAVPMLKN